MLLGVGDGTSTNMNNVDHHYHGMNTTNTTAAGASTNTNSDPREKAGRNNHNNHHHPALSAAASSMETGLIANHTQKHVGVGDPPPPAHRHIPAPPPPQQQFNQFQQHRPHQIQNSSSQTQAQAEPENKQHRGKDNILGSQVAQQQQMLNKSEEEAEELPCKPADQMGSKYEQASLGPPNNNINNQQSSAGSSAASEFHRYYGNARGGPRFDQHGGQQSPGMGVMHPSAPNSMYSSQNSHEAYQNSQYNHYPNYRPGYGTMSSPRQGNSMGPGSNTVTAAAGSHHGKATAMAAAAHSNVGGFHRFPGQSQHPSGATPTLNQLLTAPSAMMRGYGTSYPDYNSPSTPLHHQQQQQPPGLAVGMGRDMRSQYESATQGWALQQRTHPAMRPGNTMSRAQTNPMVMKRNQLYGMNSNPYSQQQGGSYSGQPYTSPPPHRYPMGMQGGNQEGMGGMQYPQQQQMPPQYSHQGLQSYYSPPQQPAVPAQPAHTQQKLPPQQLRSHELVSCCAHWNGFSPPASPCWTRWI